MNDSRTELKKCLQLATNAVTEAELEAIEQEKEMSLGKWFDIMADSLISNGVTVQKWIPVTERLPESQKAVFVSVRDKTFGYRHTLIAAHIGYHEATTEDYGWQEYDGDTEYDEKNDCFWIPECWWESNFVEDNTNWLIGSDYEVTHWMEKPESKVDDERDCKP